MKNEMENQVQEAYRTPGAQNYSRFTPIHIIIKIRHIQNKDRILKAVREKHQITYKGNPIQILGRFLSPDSKSQEVLEQYISSSERTWMPSKNPIHSKI